MNSAITTRLIVLIALACLAAGSAIAGPLNLKDGLAIQGYDPVAYFNGEPKKGRTAFTRKHGDATYRFATEANRAAFAANPSRYEPAVGGWCAYAMLEGDKVKIDPESYKIVNGRLYLFYKGILGDTRSKWNELAAEQPESELARKVNSNWTGIRNN